MESHVSFTGHKISLKRNGSNVDLKPLTINFPK